LGVRFLDSRGNELPDGGGSLLHLDRVDLDGLDPAVRAARVLVACDVDNPLLGPLGAARVYGPQKGASPGEVDILEAGLARLVEVLRAQGLDVNPDAPGSGAAGAVGVTVRELLGASLHPGFEVLGTLTGLEDVVSAADLVVTGEAASTTRPCTVRPHSAWRHSAARTASPSWPCAADWISRPTGWPMPDSWPPPRSPRSSPTSNAPWP